MSGTEANIGVDIPPVIDQRLDARRVVQAVSGFAVDREAVVMADPVSTDEIARVTSAEGLDVDVTRVSGAVTTIGTVAHDAVAPTNPVVTGGQMETMDDTAPGTRASTDGDAMKAAVADGAMFVIPSGPQIWSYHEDSSNALTDAVVHAAPGVGLSLYITTIVASIGAATAWNVFFEAPNLTTVLGPWYLEAVSGRGVNIYFATPKKIAANTALTVTTSAAISHSLDITGFISPG